MTTTNFSNRRRATHSEVPARKSRVRQQNNGIVEDIFIPVGVENAEDGGESKFGDYSTYLDLKQLSTGATFRTCVFGSSLPNSVESKILNCILPKDVMDYDPEDLIGGSFEVLLKFNTKDDKTYINVKDVRPLQAQHQQLLKQALNEEQLAYQRTKAVVSDVEEEMDGIGLFSEEESSNEPAENFTSSDTASTDEEIEETFETYEEDEEMDFFICEVCQDKGCEECDLNLGEDAADELEFVTDDTCPHCDGLGCEVCEDEEETEEY